MLSSLMSTNVLQLETRRLEAALSRNQVDVKELYERWTSLYHTILPCLAVCKPPDGNGNDSFTRIIGRDKMVQQLYQLTLRTFQYMQRRPKTLCAAELPTMEFVVLAFGPCLDTALGRVHGNVTHPNILDSEFPSSESLDRIYQRLLLFTAQWWRRYRHLALDWLRSGQFTKRVEPMFSFNQIMMDYLEEDKRHIVSLLGR